MKREYYKIYTDLAVEAKESFPGDGGEIPNVVLEEEEDKTSNMKITRVVIKNEEGAQAMGKPVGTYITLESSWILGDEEERHRCADSMADYLEELLPPSWESILVVGLGNRDMTADSLGPKVVDALWVNRHLSKKKRGLSGLVPGVMAKTGMETCEIVAGVVKEAKPDVVIVVDALAARSVKRLGVTIQLTNTGIMPGSGVGNHRNGINKDTIGVPVIAIGIPMVVGAATIACDTLDALLDLFEKSEETKELGHCLREFSEEEKFGLVRELLEPKFGPMYVTPKDVDESIGRLREVIAEGINLAVYSKS